MAGGRNDAQLLEETSRKSIHWDEGRTRTLPYELLDVTEQ